MEKKNVHKLCINCHHWRYHRDYDTISVRKYCNLTIKKANYITGEVEEKLHDKVLSNNQSQSFANMENQHKVLNKNNDCEFYEESVVSKIVNFFFGWMT